MGQTASSSVAPSMAPSPPAACPVSHKSAKTDMAQCPVAHDTLNPDNNMPTALSQNPAPHQSQDLPTHRTQSNIPRDQGSMWDYPSPQQFYNALVRKGWETPEEHIETMVEIHNFLNEQAWQEVLRWERRKHSNSEVTLSRLQGRPGELSPKARLHLFAGWLFPSRFNAEPPFDRHDWVVKRPSTGEEVRYVIDYYSAPPDRLGNPVFSLDVRPALDSMGSMKERIAVATEEMWSSLQNRAPS